MQRSTRIFAGLGIAAILLVLLALAAFFAFMGDSTVQPFIDPIGVPDGARGGAATSGSATDGAPAEKNRAESDRTDAATADALAGLADTVGELITVHGRLVVEETGAAPKNAVVEMRCKKRELEFADLYRRLGGKQKVDAMTRSGELELRVLELGGWKPTFRTAARPDGTFDLRLPKKAGVFSLEAIADLATTAHPVPFDVDDDVVRTGVTVMMNECATIEGTLLGPDGTPPSGGTVTYSRYTFVPSAPLSYSVERVVPVEAGGKFSIRGVSTDYCSITARAKGCATYYESFNYIEAGKVTKVAWTLKAESALEGSVRDSAGKPLEGIVVRLQAKRGYFEGLYGVAVSDAEGRVRWEFLESGAHTVTAYSDKLHADTVLDEITLPLEKGAPAPQWIFSSGRYISGRVKKADGSPAAGVKLDAFIWTPDGAAPDAQKDTSAKRRGSQHAESGADGAFRLDGLPDGPLQIRAVLEDVSSLTKTNIPHDSKDIELQLPPTTGISGRVVVAGKGDPVPAFHVQWVRKSEFTSMRGKTIAPGAGYSKRVSDPAGAFEIGGLDADVYVVAARVKGFAVAEPTTVTVKAGEIVKDVVLELSPAVVVTGRVIDGATGKPVASALVDAYTSEMNWGPVETIEAHTGSDGKYTLVGAKAGTFRVCASHRKLIEASSEPITATPGQTVELPDLVLTHGGAMEGVAIAPDGKPMARAVVNTYYNDPENRGGRLRRTYRGVTAGDDGSFAFEGLVPGKWEVQASPAAANGLWQEQQKGAIHGKATIVDGRTTPVEFDRPRAGGCRVHGRVTRGGKPVDNGSVYLWFEQQSGESAQPSQSAIEGSGEYELLHVAAGKATINVSVWGQSTSNLSRSITIPEAPELNLDLEMPAGCELHGRVTSAADGKPVAGITIQVWSAGRSDAGSVNVAAVTDADGRYALKNAPEGEVSVQVRAEVYQSSDELQKFVAKTRSLTLSPGGSVAADFVLDTGISIEVSVVDADGKPMGGVWVNATSRGEADESSSGYGSTDESGIVRIHGLMPGKVTASAWADKYPQANSPATPISFGSTTKIQIQFARPVAVTIRAFNSAGEQIKPVSISFTSSDGRSDATVFNNPSDPNTPKDGSMRATLAAGTYEAHVFPPDAPAFSVKIVVPNQEGAILDVRAPETKK